MEKDINFATDTWLNTSEIDLHLNHFISIPVNYCHNLEHPTCVMLHQLVIQSMNMNTNVQIHISDTIELLRKLVPVIPNTNIDDNNINNNNNNDDN